jgi:hypothetical protein
MVHDEDVLRFALNGPRNPLPVFRAEDQRSQNQEIEGALEMG